MSDGDGVEDGIPPQDAVEDDPREASTTIEKAYVTPDPTAGFRDESAATERHGEATLMPQQSADLWLELTPHDEPEGEWVEAEIPDGPVPAPLDAPPASDRSGRGGTGLRSEVRAHWRAAETPAPFNQPIVVARRKPKAKPKPKPKRAASVGARPEPVKRDNPPRSYPKMLALLRDASEVPLGDAPFVEPPPPPVPGTFFPAARVPIERPAPADLDEMLATMAEGLLIGERPDGGTEVRVTLKDEFFAGTELRISVGNGVISAELAPPDREIYWQLNANLDELKSRLGARGLEVEDVRLIEP